MKQKLIDVLETLGYPVALQGSYAEGEDLPSTFINFWNYYSEPIFYSNNVKSTVWGFRVFVYSDDPLLTNNVMKEVCNLLRQHNFFVGGSSDIDSGVEGYTGREVELNIIEEEK